MILSIFSFGFTWALIAMAFVGLAHLLPGFHTNYSQLVFGAGFRLGFVDALLLKGAEMVGLRVFNPLIYLVFFAIDWVLVLLANHPERGFYINGRWTPIITAAVLTALAVVNEMIKEWYRRKEAA